MFSIYTEGPEKTVVVGKTLGSLLRPGDVVCLYGELGAGKTRLAQGVARGLDIVGLVTSPTFTIINEYQGRLPFYHMDFYRLGDALELEDLGYEEYFYGAGVTVIEWPERAAELLPTARLDIFIDLDEEQEHWRKITFVPYTEDLTRLVEELIGLVRAGD